MEGYVAGRKACDECTGAKENKAPGLANRSNAGSNPAGTTADHPLKPSQELSLLVKAKNLARV